MLLMTECGLNLSDFADIFHESFVTFFFKHYWPLNAFDINIHLLYGKVNPSVLIGSFLVGISPYGPFPCKRS